MGAVFFCRKTLQALQSPLPISQSRSRSIHAHGTSDKVLHGDDRYSTSGLLRYLGQYMMDVLRSGKVHQMLFAICLKVLSGRGIQGKSIPPSASAVIVMRA